MSPSEPIRFEFSELTDEFAVAELWHPPILLADRDHEWLLHQQAVEACGGNDLAKHRWFLTVEEGRAHIECADCPVTFEELTELTEILSSTFKLPVEVQVQSHQHYEGDWDVEVQVHLREGADPDTDWRVLSPVRETGEEHPGSDYNLVALARLLRGWSCCGQPSLCGALCQDDELSDTLARAERLVRESLASKSTPVVE